MTVALLRFRAAAARCGEPFDQLSDEQLLTGLGRVCAEGTFASAALRAAGIERVGPEWAELLEVTRATCGGTEKKSRSTRSLRRRILGAGAGTSNKAAVGFVYVGGGQERSSWSVCQFTRKWSSRRRIHPRRQDLF